MQINIPSDVKRIIDRIEDAGYEAYAVGGCVRDALLLNKPHDWDITTSAPPLKVKELFDRTFDTGLQHGTVTVLMAGNNYEVTTYRIDGAYSDGRHPESVIFTRSLEEDLARRDFTINAMAYHPERGIVDLFGGREDLAAGIIRCVGDPKERFTEDALRMMRAVRFSARLGFEIEQGTADAVRELYSRLSMVSQERITDELVKLLISERPAKIKTAYELGLTSVFFPEFDEMMACTQKTVYHSYTVGEHTLKVLEGVPGEKYKRLAALLHDVGKLYTKTIKEGVEHFYGHAAVSAERSEQILKRFKLDNETIRRVKILAKYHDARFEVTEENVRRLIGNVGRDLMPALLELMDADLSGKSEYAIKTAVAHLQSLHEVYDIVSKRGDAVCIAELDVTGDDLMAAGVPGGKAVGECLGKLLELVLKDPTLNKKDILLKKSILQKML